MTSGTTREKVRALADGIRTAGEIAEVIGVSGNRVRVIAAEDGLALAAAPAAGADAWPDEKIADLTRMWGEGLSFGQIAIALGDGITRSAVGAKVSRLGLPKRGAPNRRARPADAKSGGAPAEASGTPGPAADPDIVVRATARALVDRPGLAGVHLSMLPGALACRFPLWESNADPLWMRYCGAKAPEGRSYCPHHDYRMHFATVAEAGEPEPEAEEDEALPPAEEDGEEAEVAA